MAKGTRRKKDEMTVATYEQPAGGDADHVEISDTPWNTIADPKPNISWLALGPEHTPEAVGNDALDELPIEVLADLQEQMTHQENLLEFAFGRMADLIERKYGERLKTAQASADTGTFRIPEGNYEIKMAITKRVEWDQEFLSALRMKISAAGDNPDTYIKTTYGVSERDYTGWNDAIKNTFLAGRTVKPSKPSYSIEIKF